jgi:RNA polymerase sigma-70 factor (ECF subfamily)
VTELSEEPADTDLLRAHVEGDPNAFAELVLRHRNRLWAVALRTTGDPEDAADALQEALLSAFRRAESFRGDAQVTTWLHRIVVNACLDRLRRRSSKRTEPLPDEGDHAAILAAPQRADDAVEVAERRADVFAALAKLSEEQRAALVLVDMEGYSVEEAADLLGCAPGTVKSRCSRGRARLVPLLATYRRNLPESADVQPSQHSPRRPSVPQQPQSEEVAPNLSPGRPLKGGRTSL